MSETPARVVKTVKLDLTAEEVVDCTMPGNLINGLKLVPKRGGPKDKTSYCDIIRPKLFAAVDNRSTKFTFSDKPMSTGKSNIVIYTRCSHNDKRSGIFFEKRNLIIGQPLSLSFANECKLCDGSTGGISNSGNSDIAGNVEFGDLIGVIKDGLNELVKKIQRECLNADDPIKHYYENYASYGIDANKVFITVAKEIQPPSVADSQSLGAITSELNESPEINADVPSLTVTTSTLRENPLESTPPLTSDTESPSELDGPTPPINSTCPPLTTATSPLVGIPLEPTTSLVGDLTIPSTTATTIPSNLKSTNSAGFQQLTSFTSALNAPMLILSSDADGNQQITHLMSQESDGVEINQQDLILETIGTPNILVRMIPATPTTPTYEPRSLRSAERAAISAANEAISAQSMTPKNSRKRTPRAILALQQQEENLQKKSRAI